MGDRLGLRIERAVSVEALALLLAVGGEVMLRITCKYDYVHVQRAVKLFLRSNPDRMAFLMGIQGLQAFCSNRVSGQDSAYSHDVVSFTPRSRRPFNNRASSIRSGARNNARPAANCTSGSSAMLSVQLAGTDTKCSPSLYRNLADARARIGRFLEDVYNDKRLHSALQYVAPNEFERRLTSPASSKEAA